MPIDNSAQPAAAPQQDGDPNPGGMGGLGAVSMMLGGVPLAGSSQIDQLATQPVIDPGNKWLAYASAMLAPSNKGNFGAGLSSALGALAGAGTQEAELKAKYLPIVAQALLQRQQLQFTMAQSSYKLAQDWDGALSGGMTGLLSAGNTVTPESVVNMARGQVASGKVPLPYAQQWLSSAPLDQPDQLAGWARAKAVSAMNPDSRLGAVSPNVDITNAGGSQVPVNKNANAPGGIGPVGGGAVPTTLTPSQKLPVAFDTPYGKRVYSPTDPSQSATVGTPGAGQLGGGAAPLPGGPVDNTGLSPSAPPGLAPSAPAPGLPGTPAALGASQSAALDPARMEADKGLATDFSKYLSGLNDKASAAADLNQRIGAMRSYTTAFRSGAIADPRMQAGATLKDLALTLGLPQNQADSLGNKIMGGDISSAQSFQKLAVQGTMEALRMAASGGASGSGGQRFTQFEFSKFLNNNLNLNTDPRAMEKIQNFLADQYNRTLAEQNYATREYQAGTPIPQIRNNWSQLQAATVNPPTRQTGAAMGTGGEPKTTYKLGTTTDGLRFKVGPSGIPEYD